MKVTLTGASGRIGQPVIDALMPHHELILFSRRTVTLNLEQRIGSLTSVKDCLKAVHGSDAVVHLAAKSMPGEETFGFNMASMYALLEASRLTGVRRFLFASTNCVYGHCFPLSERKYPLAYLPIDEEHPCQPEDNYGLSKLLNEQMLALYSRNWGIRAAAFRLSWVWGSEEIRKRREKLRFNDEGNASFFWAYVDSRDVGKAFQQALTSERMPEFGVYNIHAADHMSELDSLSLIAKFYPNVPLRKDIPGRTGLFDCSRAREDFDFMPQYSWRD
jgi:nucleoside-diphosphate-sugar epimerase